MGQKQDGTEQAKRAGEDFEQLRDACDAARSWLFFLIGNPDKCVSVAEYRAMLKKANDEHAAAHDAMMAAWA